MSSRVLMRDDVRSAEFEFITTIRSMNKATVQNEAKERDDESNSYK